MSKTVYTAFHLVAGITAKAQRHAAVFLCSFWISQRAMDNASAARQLVGFTKPFCWGDPQTSGHPTSIEAKGITCLDLKGQGLRFTWTPKTQKETGRRQKPLPCCNMASTSGSNGKSSRPAQEFGLPKTDGTRFRHRKLRQHRVNPTQPQPSYEEWSTKC